MKIQTVSDTHTYHKKLKLFPADVIIHAGDFCTYGTEAEALDFLDWYGHLESKYRILVPGNHDVWAEKNLEQFRKICKELDIIPLIDESVTIDGVKFWGSPVTCRYGYGWAWQRDRSRDKAEGRAFRGVQDAGFIGNHWDKIPEDTDVVICHQPCYGIMDEVVDENPVGCPILRDKIQAIKPNLFVCGHIHQARGKKMIDGTTYINTATVIGFHEINT